MTDEETRQKVREEERRQLQEVLMSPHAVYEVDLTVHTKHGAPQDLSLTLVGRGEVVFRVLSAVGDHFADR